MEIICWISQIQSTGLPSIPLRVQPWQGVKGGGLSMYTSVMEMGYLSNMLTGFTVPGLETRLQ